MYSIFNTQKFFEQTAHFASQGRGLFKITSVPEIFADSTDTKIVKGFELLKEGIVAKSFGIPGQQLATFDATSWSGPSRKMPYMQVFGDIDVEFMLMDQDQETAASVYYTFIKWQELIAGPVETNTIAKTVRSDSTAFGVRYYDDYCVDATAQIYTPTASQNRPAIEVQYTELYPLSVGGLNTSWDSPDSPLSLRVGFTYHYSKIRS